MKLAIWTNSPSPHQHDFHTALRSRGIDLCVRYFGHLRAARRRMGWTEPDSLPEGERVLAMGEAPLDSVDDAAERVHLVPGYGHPNSRRIARELSRAGTPWAHWSEASQPSWRSPLLAPLKRLYAGLVNRCALGAFAQGELAARDFVRWGIDRDRIAPLYYSIAPTTSSEPDKELKAWLAGRNGIAFVGSLIPLKDPLGLIHAFANNARSRDGSALVLIGGGPLEDSCRSEAKRLGIEDSVRLAGVMPMQRVPSALACCSTIVLPSHYDGWGMALTEGAAAGLAIVASEAVGAARHLVAPGENGALFRSRDVRSMTRALAPYMTDPDLAARHGERSRQLLEDFSPDRNVQRCLRSIEMWLARDPKWARWRGRGTSYPMLTRDRGPSLLAAQRSVG